MNPLLTICVPTRNRAAMLPAAVKSALAQKPPAGVDPKSAWLEVLIADDASDDGETRLVCADLERLAPGVVRVVRAERNLGIYANYTRCVAESCGEFVAFMSDDDEFASPNACAVRLERLRACPKAALCYGGHRDLRVDGSTRDKFPHGAKWQEETARDFVLRCVVEGFSHTWNAVMLRREPAVAALPFDESIFPESDHDYQLRMAALSGMGAAYVDEIVVLRRHHAGNTYARHQAKETGNADALLSLREKRRKVMGDWFRFRRRALELLARRDREIEREIGALMEDAADRFGWSRLRIAAAQIKNGEHGDAVETAREAPMVSDSLAVWALAQALGGAARLLEPMRRRGLKM